MLIYPQLSTGALTQFPIRKWLRRRTVINAAADGRSVRHADDALRVTEWELNYSGLTDQEAGMLEQFFLEAEGTLNGFVFADPTANLLAKTEALDAAIWQPDPQLSFATGIPDPNGGAGAWRLTNLGIATQGVRQTLVAPGEYTYTFSIYVKGSGTERVVLTAGENQAEYAVPNMWKRISLTGAGATGADSVRFGLGIPPGTSVDAYGPQAEAQPAASTYRPGVESGAYANAHLATNAMAMTATGPNQHSCSLRIIHVNHL